MDTTGLETNQDKIGRSTILFEYFVRNPRRCSSNVVLRKQNSLAAGRHVYLTGVPASCRLINGTKKSLPADKDRNRALRDTCARSPLAIALREGIQSGFLASLSGLDLKAHEYSVLNVQRYH
tara:strand:- start:1566 stop:1931 length:366 start_codon:yes stop_codon:yes gene_type:complete